MVTDPQDSIRVELAWVELAEAAEWCPDCNRQSLYRRVGAMEVNGAPRAVETQQGCLCQLEEDGDA